MSDLPQSAGDRPAVLNLDAGTYWWCSCGKSKAQPWCDGTHKGSGLSPVKFVLEAPKSVAVCMCKGSANPVLCDGSHGRTS